MKSDFTRPYMLKMKLRYAKAKTKTERTALIDETIAMTQLSRKYVIRLLTGSRQYRKHRGRGPTYSPIARKLLVQVWRAEGYMCPLYLQSIIVTALKDYEELGHKIPPNLIDELTSMSASTMNRILRPYRIQRSPNKRSGSKAALASTIPAGPGVLDEDGEVGILQVDTVALCGNSTKESFFWILHFTDAVTQWDACAPAWNRGAEATMRALLHIFERLPFRPRVLHIDNGGEFINHHLITFLRTYYPDVRITRSRPYRKNDNNRIEQKNGSIIRELFGDLRFDDYSQLEALTALCDQWSLLHNFTIPCRRQISKVRHPNPHGITYTRSFDTPQTPWQRLNTIHPQPLPPHINSIQLRRICERTLNRLYLTQKS